MTTRATIPSGLWPHFQEYDPQQLDPGQDADLIIQRTLEYGTWEEIRWLALHLGHRFSVDLDFFSSDPDAVGPDQRAVMQTAFNDPSLVITHDKDMTFVATWQDVGISFFRLALYPLVQEPVLFEGVPVATVEEIGAMKLAAIIARGTRKDYVDLYFILQQAPLERLFQVGAVRYARVRSFAASSLRALAYFADAETTPMPRMIDRASWTTIKRFLERQAMEAGRKNLEDLWSG